MGSKTTDRPTTGAKDIYLLMRPEMIRATLKGQKWQTRRVVKPSVSSSILGNSPGRKPTDWQKADYFRRFHNNFGPSEKWWSAYRGDGSGTPKDSCIGHLQSPYGQPGDLAVVRESFRLGKSLDHMKPLEAMAQAKEVGYEDTVGPVWYEVDGAYRRWSDYDLADFGGKGKLRGPYEMPRCAARIVRPITSIRIERVAEISEGDVIAEGLTDTGWHWKYWCQDPRQAYRRLWNSINLTPKPRYGRVPVAYDHPSEGLNPTKKGITHYEALPWSVEDFDAAYPGAREAGTWKGKPLVVHPNPWVWAVGFEKMEAQDAN